MTDRDYRAIDISKDPSEMYRGEWAKKLHDDVYWNKLAAQLRVDQKLGTAFKAQEAQFNKGGVIAPQDRVTIVKRLSEYVFAAKDSAPEPIKSDETRRIVAQPTFGTVEKPLVKQKSAVDDVDIDYGSLAGRLTVDEKKPELFLAEPDSNVFANGDKITLAGKAAFYQYDRLVERPGYNGFSEAEVPIVAEKMKNERTMFVAWVDQYEANLDEQAKAHFRSGRTFTDGMDGFSFNGERAEAGFPMYFKKDRRHYKDRRASDVRAYISLKSELAEPVPVLFCQLCDRLYQAGIDFESKACNAANLFRRLDNLVFYISGPDKEAAEKIIGAFLQEKQIGNSHLPAAEPSSFEGLSWAPEMNEVRNQIWREISGSSKDGSFNMYVSARLMPDYLKRLAFAHQKKNNLQFAVELLKEADRVQQIIDKYERQAASGL